MRVKSTPIIITPIAIYSLNTFNETFSNNFFPANVPAKAAAIVINKRVALPARMPLPLNM